MNRRFLLLAAGVVLAGSIWGAYREKRFTADGIKYLTLSEQSVEIVGSETALPDTVVLPDRVTHDGIDYNVISVGEYAFMGDSVMKVLRLPESLAYIGYGSFSECRSLEEVELPSALHSIGIAAFNYCTSLKKVAIPESVISMGDAAFESCYSLTDVWIKGNLEGIYPRTFKSCSHLESVRLPETIKFIGDKAFNGCTRLKRLEIPDAVEEIDRQAFEDCTVLSTVNLPASLRSLGKSAFAHTSVTNVVCPVNLTEVPQRCYDNCTNLRTVEFNDKITTIGAFAFFNCTELVGLTFPKSVTSLGSGAFEGCLMECLSFNSRDEFPATSFTSVFGARNLKIMYIAFPSVEVTSDPTSDTFLYQIWDAIQDKSQVKTDFPAGFSMRFGVSHDSVITDYASLSYGQDLFMPIHESVALDFREVDMSEMLVFIDGRDVSDFIVDGILTIQADAPNINLTVKKAIQVGNGSGIETVTAYDSVPAALFTTSGVRVNMPAGTSDVAAWLQSSQLPKGVYIVVENGYSRKILHR